MKGMGLAVFSEPASPVPGYDLSRIIADPEQSQEMKLTHAKLHYSRVRMLLPSSVSNARQGQHRKLMAGSRAPRCARHSPSLQLCPWGCTDLCCTAPTAQLLSDPTVL